METKTLKELNYNETEEIICANCGTNIIWLLKKGKIAYYFNNDEIMCSKKCLKEYAISYFTPDVIIKKER